MLFTFDTGGAPDPTPTTLNIAYIALRTVFTISCEEYTLSDADEATAVWHDTLLVGPSQLFRGVAIDDGPTQDKSIKLIL